MSVDCNASLEAAKALSEEGKFFDAVQKINECIEAYAVVLGEESDPGLILKDAEKFLKERLPSMSQEQEGGSADHGTRHAAIVGRGHVVSIS